MLYLLEKNYVFVIFIIDKINICLQDDFKRIIIRILEE